MKKAIIKNLLSLFTAALIVTTASAQNIKPLDTQVLDYMKDYSITGSAFSLVKDGKIALAKGYGHADSQKDIPFTPNTIMEVASISKMVTATAAMQLWERDSFELDDPINDYLPFDISNPDYPETPITFRMLLTHTSSVFGNESDIPWSILAVDPGTAMPLGEYLESRLVPGGDLYNYSTDSYYSVIPGSQFHYSNTGYAVLGYLVEMISGMPFDEYCDENIFQPLCMNSTAWYYSQLNMDLVSIPYDPYSQTANSGYYFFDFYEALDYPCRQMKTNVVDLSKFMQMHMNYGILDGNRIIDSTTAALMRVTEVTAGVTADFRLDHTLGFFKPYWFATQQEYLGHDGTDDGVGTYMFINLTDNTGTIFFQNAWPFYPQVFDVTFYLDNLVDTMTVTSEANLTCSYLLKPCQHSINYWKNNPSAWPVNASNIRVGTKHYYTINQAIDVLNLPVNGDASRVLAKSLIAAKVNVAQGSELAPIYSTLNDAMEAIGTKRIPYNIPVSFSSATGIQMLALAATLDSYNSGSMNAVACSGSSARESADMNDDIPMEYSVSNYPNPVSSAANISFILPQTENVSLKIVDVNGRLVSILANQVFEGGENKIEWHAADINAGIYFLRFETASYSENRKLIVTK
jgi:CubicO group peptidase (beta-lactamase class C family)